MRTSWPSAAATPTDPHIKYSRMLNAGVSTCTRVTPEGGGAGFAAAAAAFSSSFAAV